MFFLNRLVSNVTERRCSLYNVFVRASSVDNIHLSEHVTAEALVLGPRACIMKDVRSISEVKMLLDVIYKRSFIALTSGCPWLSPTNI